MILVKKQELDINRFKQDLIQLCLEDFNGNAGEDYLDEVEIDGVIKKISTFEYWWDALEKDNLSIADIARKILYENFESDKDFYIEYTFKVIETEKEIIVFTAAMTYC